MVDEWGGERDKHVLDGFTYWLCKVLVHIVIILCSEFA